jgi:hypothetical protein
LNGLAHRPVPCLTAARHTMVTSLRCCAGPTTRVRCLEPPPGLLPYKKPSPPLFRVSVDQQELHHRPCFPLLTVKPPASHAGSHRSSSPERHLHATSAVTESADTAGRLWWVPSPLCCKMEPPRGPHAHGGCGLPVEPRRLGRCLGPASPSRLADAVGKKVAQEPGQAEPRAKIGPLFILDFFFDYRILLNIRNSKCQNHVENCRNIIKIQNIFLGIYVSRCTYKAWPQCHFLDISLYKI